MSDIVCIVSVEPELVTVLGMLDCICVGSSETLPLQNGFPPADTVLYLYVFLCAQI